MSFADYTPARRAPARKDTRRWCKGKSGREHVPRCVSKRWRPDRPPYLYVLECSTCGKHLALWWTSFDRREAPPWVRREP